MSTPETVDVVVIGAGQAGLSAAYHLHRRGFVPLGTAEGASAARTFVVLDANDAPGGAWQHRWRSLTMSTVNGIYDLPGMPKPELDPASPSVDVIPPYFAAFEERFALAVRRPVQVRAVRREDDDPHGRLLVETAASADSSGADSPAAVAKAKVEVIITMLPTADHVKQVYRGKDGLLANIGQGVLLIDSSTIDPLSAREVAKFALAQGNPMLDAPVSGGTGGAAAGTLTFMVGGPVSVFDQALPILSAMGRNIVHCGGAGNGQVAKIANNMLLGISMVGVAESMALGVALGMDAKVLAGVIGTSTGRCWSSEINNPFPGVLENAPASRGYSGGFGTDLMLKDLGLATEAAKHARQPVVLGAAAQQLYQTFSLQGNGGLDFSAIIKLFRGEAQA